MIFSEIFIQKFNEVRLYKNFSKRTFEFVFRWWRAGNVLFLSFKCFQKFESDGSIVFEEAQTKNNKLII